MVSNRGATMHYTQTESRDIDYKNRDRCPVGLVFIGALALISGPLASCRGVAPAERLEVEIRALLDRQVQDWNAGNLAGYMEGYEKSDQLRFLSGGDVTLGWQTVHDRYRNRFRDRAAMGRLTFSELTVQVLSGDAALAHGRWQLQRQADQPSGLFTLLLRKGADGWRIRHDHTSSK
jgi:ketosteroid isomerase-like protein